MRYRYLLTVALALCTVVSAQAQSALKGKALFGDMRARQIGPAVMSGRVADLDVVNTDPNVIYIGSATGGVWKSVNGGATFNPIFDDYTQSIGKVTIDQQRPDTVWVGTGEPWTRNSVSVGDGIYLTTDGGKSWTKKGLDKTERIADIIIHPQDPNVVYVAALGKLWGPNPERGVYRTKDGGETWENILYFDENTGAADLSIDPNDPNVLYAAMWDFRRTPYSFNSGGPGSALYKTTDGGANWNKITNDLPKGILGRMAVELAPSKPNVVYLTVEAEKKEDEGLYKSTNGGESWELINSDFNLTVRPFYFSRLLVAPSNDSIVYKCGLSMSYSEDGGFKFTQVGGGVHSDAHAMWINPANSKHVVIGTDGGAYRSTDGGRTFEMFMGLPLSQFYTISVDMAEPYNVYGGLQDNGSWKGPSAKPGGISNGDWELVNWGDGFHVVPHPTDENIVYAESQGGNMVRSDFRDNQKLDIKPYPRSDEPEFRWNWNTPIVQSPNNPERIYSAAQFLFASDDRGNSWKRLSGDLTTNDPNRQKQKESGGLSKDNSSAENNTTIYAVAESTLDGEMIWVGTDDGYVQLTTNGGKDWQRVSDNITGVPAFAWVTDIEPGHFDKQTAYVTIDNHRNGDNTPYVYRTTDGGQTWQSLVTDDIEGYALSFCEDLVNPNLLFLGTEFGLYISTDAGKSWGRFENNVPKVGVRAMVIHPREHSLVLGTHGRGVIIIDDLSPLRQLNEEMMAKKIHFFEQEPMWAGGFGFGGGGNNGANNFTASNPNEAFAVTYYAKKRHTFGKMKIELFDPKGELIQEIPAGKSGGINAVSLPTRYEKPKGPPSDNRMAAVSGLFGPPLPAGVYKVVLTKGRDKFETNVELIPDPKSPATDEDRAVQFKTVMELYSMIEGIGYKYHVLSQLHDNAMTMASQNKKAAKKLKLYAASLKSLRDELVFKGGDFYVDEDERLAEKVQTLYLTINLYQGRPTESHLDRLAALKKEVEEFDARFKALNGPQLEKVNKLLQKTSETPLAADTFDDYKGKP